MPDILYEIKVGCASELISQIIVGAKRYCGYDDNQRQQYLKDGVIYMKIELWDGRIVFAIPVESHLSQSINELDQFVLMNGPEADEAISGSVVCILDEVNTKFVTQTDMRDSKDILLWQIKSS